MNRENLYHKTVDILVQAYFNDTLEHQNCYACAVGNIIAANCGLKFIKCESIFSRPFKVYPGMGNLYWHERNNFEANPLLAIQDGEVYFPLNEEQVRFVESTGYSVEELALIESAFEKVVHNIGIDFVHEDKYMFDGLMAVIEALDEIHENKDPEVSTKSKNRFCKV